MDYAGDAEAFAFVSAPLVHNALLKDTALHYRAAYADITNMSANSQFGHQSNTWKFGESAAQSSAYTSITEVAVGGGVIFPLSHICFLSINV